MKYCLIIDDTNQQEEITILEKKSRQNNFPITCYFFNPSQRECQRPEKKADGTIEYHLDEELVLLELKKAFPIEQIDLIATDYRLSDKNKTGLDIVHFLKEKNWRGKTPYVIYSGESDKIKETLQNNIQEVIEDKDKLKSFIESYHDTNPSRIFNRKESIDHSYTDDIYGFLKKNKSSLNNKLSQKLNQHPDHNFGNIFPHFDGYKLKVLSDLVLENSVESDSFEDEFLDRSVDHFIFLKY